MECSLSFVWYAVPATAVAVAENQCAIAHRPQADVAQAAPQADRCASQNTDREAGNCKQYVVLFWCTSVMRRQLTPTLLFFL
jgi:hypothetical protein